MFFVAFAGCWPACASGDETLSVFDAATGHSGRIREVFLLVLAITGGIFLVVEGLILFCVIRYRRRPDEAQEPPQIYGSRRVELAWTIAPLLIVFVLFLVVFRSLAELRLHHPPADALVVRVIGHQWWWEYEIPSLGVRTANELHLPAGTAEHPRPVAFELESYDVIHSFWLPRLAGKTDVVPGRVNSTWFSAPIPGLYLGQCAEYCGTQHGNMLLRVNVEPEEQFARWAANEAAAAAADPKVDAGRRLFLSLACVNCHTVRGTSARGVFGPDLTHLASRQTLAAGMVANDPASLRAWLANPQQVKPGCNMPDMHLEPAQVDRLVEYLGSLR